MTFLERGGVRIHYESVGEGPAVVLQTGAGGDSQIWRLAGYVEGLAGFRTILLDQRGRGQSDRPKALAAHRMEEFVADLAAVLDDAGVESAAYWGYSNGVRVGIAFGAAHPKRLRALLGTGGIRYRDMTELPRVDVQAEIDKDVARGGSRRRLTGSGSTSTTSSPRRSTGTSGRATRSCMPWTASRGSTGGARRAPSSGSEPLG